MQSNPEPLVCATNYPTMQVWHLGPRIHNAYGPAVEHKNGGKEWYINGQFFTFIPPPWTDFNPNFCLYEWARAALIHLKCRQPTEQEVEQWMQKQHAAMILQ